MPKIAPTFSHTDEKQDQVVKLIKRFEVEPQLKVRINQNIPGLRKKKHAFGAKPNNRVWWSSFSSFERNGYINVGLSRNYVRIFYPLLPMTFLVYFMQPVVSGTYYI